MKNFLRRNQISPCLIQKVMKWPWTAIRNSFIHVAASVKQNSTECCLESSIHGLKYLGQSNRGFIEKVFWLTSFLISTSVALYLIVVMFNDYIHEPMITVTESDPRHLAQIPFPAVTICSQNQLTNHAFSKLTRKFQEISPEISPNKEQLQLLAKLVDMVDICLSKFPLEEEILEVREVSLKLQNYTGRYKDSIARFVSPLQTMVEESQQCKDLIKSCSWGDMIISQCAEYFNGVITELGYCCTLNSVPVSTYIKNGDAKMEIGNDAGEEHWDLLNSTEKLSYKKLLQEPASSYFSKPLKQVYRGKEHGLKISLASAYNDTFCPYYKTEGSIVLIHTQLDYPSNAGLNVAVTPGNKLSFGISPEITLSEESNNFFRVAKRGCYYDDEYPLEWYKYYTQSNCIDECYFKNIIKECRCAPNYVPYGKNAVTLCNATHLDCLRIHGKPSYLRTQPEGCKLCLPPCAKVEYRKGIINAPLKATDIPSLWMWPYFGNNEHIDTDLSVVEVYMDIDSVFAKIRKDSTSLIQLLSNAGGLLGLFMGFSVLSLLELLYYGTSCFRCSVRTTSVEESTLPIQEKIVNTGNIDGMFNQKLPHTNHFVVTVA